MDIQDIGVVIFFAALGAGVFMALRWQLDRVPGDIDDRYDDLP